MSVQLSGVHWVDPASGHDDRCDLLATTQGLQQVERIDPKIACVDARSLTLIPGFVDLGCSLPQADLPHGDSIAVELRAARQNGFDLVCGAPDAQPLIDSAAAIEWIERRAAGADGARLRLLGALTQGLNGTALSNMAALKASGCVGLAQGRAALPAADTLRQCLRYAADLALRVHLRPQWPSLSAGCAHDGAQASALGLAGVPVVAETAAVAMILCLVRDSGCAVHFERLSCAASTTMLAAAKQEGLPVSADVSIWNLLFDDAAIAGYDSQFHLNPPLRSGNDRQALCAAVRNGVIDAISADHRPLGADAKLGPFAETQAGASSLDAYLPLLLQLMQRESLSWLDIARLSHGAAASLLAEVPQRWSLIDPAMVWTADTEHCLSQGQNNPLRSQSLRGRVAGDLSGGELRLGRHWQHLLGV